MSCWTADVPTEPGLYWVSVHEMGRRVLIGCINIQVGRWGGVRPARWLCTCRRAFKPITGMEFTRCTDFQEPDHG